MLLTYPEAHPPLKRHSLLATLNNKSTESLHFRYEVMHFEIILTGVYVLINFIVLKQVKIMCFTF